MSSSTRTEDKEITVIQQSETPKMPSKKLMPVCLFGYLIPSKTRPKIRPVQHAQSKLLEIPTCPFFFSSNIKRRQIQGHVMPRVIPERSKWMSSAKESVILKVLIIGDPCVGKTSFVQRYVNGTFHKNYKGTIGVDFALKIVKWDGDATVKVQMWDVAGQERYTSMTRVYYRDAHGCVVMFDLTNRNTFLNVVKWKRDFDSKCVLPDGQPIPCLLIANKSDAIRQVTDEEIERMCTEFNFYAWTEMSVKDNVMVDDSMKYIVSCILNQERSNAGIHKNHSASMSSSRDGALRLGAAAGASDEKKSCSC